MTFQITNIQQRPDLLGQATTLLSNIWPKFLQEDQIAYEYWARLYTDFPTYQILLLDTDGTLVSVGNSLPLAWNNSDEELPEGGWRWALAQGFLDLEANLTSQTQCALSITLNPNYLGQGVSSIVVKAMKEVGVANQLKQIIAPVRPNLKSRYPLIPMKEYIQWKNDAGLPFDAWLRVHYRLGARIAKVCAKSMRIVGTIGDWERWTGLKIPQSGLYLVDGGLVPMKVSKERNMGVYLEPNVWMVAPL